MSFKYTDIPMKMNNFNVFEGSDRLLGVAKATLPKFTYKKESVEGAGIGGTVDVVIDGHLEAITFEMDFRSIDSQNCSFTPKAKNYTLKGSLQLFDDSAKEYKNAPLVMEFRMQMQEIDTGNAEVGKGSGAKVKFNVISVKIFIEGKEVRHVDPFAMIDAIDGVDYLAEIRSQIGM